MTTLSGIVTSFNLGFNGVISIDSTKSIELNRSTEIYINHTKVRNIKDVKIGDHVQVTMKGPIVQKVSVISIVDAELEEDSTESG